MPLGYLLASANQAKVRLAEQSLDPSRCGGYAVAPGSAQPNSPSTGSLVKRAASTLCLRH